MEVCYWRLFMFMNVTRMCSVGLIAPLLMILNLNIQRQWMDDVLRGAQSPLRRFALVGQEKPTQARWSCPRSGSKLDLVFVSPSLFRKEFARWRPSSACAKVGRAGLSIKHQKLKSRPFQEQALQTQISQEQPSSLRKTAKGSPEPSCS